MGSPRRKKSFPLSGDEWKQVFEAVASGGGEDTLKGLRRQLSDRNRVTVDKAYKTAREFELSKPDRMGDGAADQISEKVRYSATQGYVQDAFLKWRAWRGHQGTKHDEVILDEICGLREDVRGLQRYFESIMPHILGSSHVHTDDTLMMLTTHWTGAFRGGMHAWEWDQSEGVNGTLKLGVENDPMFPMLREHLADRSFGYIFDAWKRSVEYLLWLCRELSSEMTLVCQQRTGASVLKAGARSRDTLFWEFSRQVYRRQLLRAEGSCSGPKAEARGHTLSTSSPNRVTCGS